MTCILCYRLSIPIKWSSITLFIYFNFSFTYRIWTELLRVWKLCRNSGTGNSLFLTFYETFALKRIYHRHWEMTFWGCIHIFLVTYKKAQQDRVLHYSRLEIRGKDKHPSLLDPFGSYAKNEVSWNALLGPYSQHFILFVTYELAQQDRVLHYNRMEILGRDKYSSLLGPFTSYAKNEVLWIRTLVFYKTF